MTLGTHESGKKTITFDETEVGPLADCECMTNVAAVIEGIEKGDYTLHLTRGDMYVEISVTDKVTEHDIYLRK